MPQKRHIVRNEKRDSKGRGVHQGESQIALGAWEDTQGDQDGSKTKERVNSGVPKLQDCTRVSITNDK